MNGPAVPSRLALKIAVAPYTHDPSIPDSLSKSTEIAIAGVLPVLYTSDGVCATSPRCRLHVRLRPRSCFDAASWIMHAQIALTAAGKYDSAVRCGLGAQANAFVIPMMSATQLFRLIMALR